MKVRFPMYFEVVGYGELDLPDSINPDDEDAVKEFIEDEWPDIPLPDLRDCEDLPESCVFDWDSVIEVYEA